MRCYFQEHMNHGNLYWFLSVGFECKRKYKYQNHYKLNFGQLPTEGKTRQKMCSFVVALKARDFNNWTVKVPVNWSLTIQTNHLEVQRSAEEWNAQWHGIELTSILLVAPNISIFDSQFWFDFCVPKLFLNEIWLCQLSFSWVIRRSSICVFTSIIFIVIWPAHFRTYHHFCWFQWVIAKPIFPDYTNVIVIERV